MLPEFLEYGFMQRAFAVGIVTALICPAIGAFLIPRRLSLISDTLAHVALAGVALGLLLGLSPVIPSLTGFAVARSFGQATGGAIAAALASVTVGLIAAYYLRLAAGGAVVLTALLIFGATTLARRSTALRTGVALAALLGVSLATAPRAGAHPHVFVDHALTVIVGAEGLEGIQFAWTFDDMFSSMLVMTFDADKDKTFSTAEVKTVEQKHFSHLKEFSYFVTLKVNDKPVAVTSYRDFQARLVNGQVIYLFTVPVKAAEGTLEVAVEDPTYYSAFALNSRAPAQVQSGKNYRVDCRVARDSGSLSEVVKCAFKRQGR